MGQVGRLGGSTQNNLRLYAASVYVVMVRNRHCEITVLEALMDEEE